MPNVHYTPRVSSVLDNLRQTHNRLDNALESAATTAWESPETYPSVIGSDPQLRRIQLRPLPGVPPLSLYFYTDDTTVFFTIAELYDVG